MGNTSTRTATFISDHQTPDGGERASAPAGALHEAAAFSTRSPLQAFFDSRVLPAPRSKLHTSRPANKAALTSPSVVGGAEADVILPTDAAETLVSADQP